MAADAAVQPPGSGKLDSCHTVRGLNRHLPRKEVIGGSPQGIDVRKSAEAGKLAILLKRCIPESEYPGHLACLPRSKLPSRSKVNKNCPAILYQHHVLGLDVAVNHVRLMHHPKGACHLLDNLHEKPLFDRPGFFNHLEQRLALKQ